MSENRIKHLEFIQNIINRQAKNSFLIKGWTITLLSAISVLIIEKGKFELIYILYFILIAFWILDSYYLYLERKFRVLYKLKRSVTDDAKVDFDLDIKKTTEKGANWICSFLSISMLIFYGSIIGFFLFFNHIILK